MLGELVRRGDLKSGRPEAGPYTQYLATKACSDGAEKFPNLASKVFDFT
jgi:hypothetical protein